MLDMMKTTFSHINAKNPQEKLETQEYLLILPLCESSVAIASKTRSHWKSPFQLTRRW